MRIVGIDPGGTTGIALILGLIPSGGWTVDTGKSLADLYMTVFRLNPEVLVVEDFIIGPGHRSKDIQIPIKVIGVCEMLADKMGIKCVLSNPSVLQGHQKPRGANPHIWSAQTHALHYASRSICQQPTSAKTGSS
jgi:hypothetical protein